MGSLAVATLAAQSYRAFARVLAQSFRRFHPEVPFFIVAVDGAAGGAGGEPEPCGSMALAELSIPDLELLRFRYTRRQLAIAAKAYLLGGLLDRGFTSVLFLDADLLVLGDLTPCFEVVARHALTLTPHLLAPPEGNEPAARELAILRAGVFNGGCIGVSATPEARRFLAWWQERLHEHCLLDVAHGLQHDQRWLDFAPSFVRELAILRDPGINVAPWNLDERPLARCGDAWSVAGAPCRLFHFSGYDPDRPQQLSRHWPSAGASSLPVQELAEAYREKLLAAGYRETHDLPYAYGTFTNGVPIPEVARQLHAELGAAAARFGDPFAAEGAGSFFSWLTAPARPGAGGGRPVPRLWEGIWRRRPDLQATFADLHGADREAFLTWAERFGAVEHAIPEPLQVPPRGRWWRRLGRERPASR